MIGRSTRNRRPSANFTDSDFSGTHRRRERFIGQYQLWVSCLSKLVTVGREVVLDGDDEGTVAFDPNDTEASLGSLQSPFEMIPSRSTP